MQYFQGRGTKENVGVGLRRLSPPREFAPMRPTVEMPAMTLERLVYACKGRAPSHETVEMKAVVVPPEALPSQQEPLDILDEWIVPNDE